MAHTEPDYSTFPELIGVTSACQETIPLWKCSVNYWATNKHPLCHFWLSYLRWANGCDALLLSAQGHLISVSRRNSTICSRSAVSLLDCYGLGLFPCKWNTSMQIWPATCQWKGKIDASCLISMSKHHIAYNYIPVLTSSSGFPI